MTGLLLFQTLKSLHAYKGGTTKTVGCMREQDFIDYLSGHREEYEYMQGEHAGQYGVFVKNKRFETEMHFTYDTIGTSDLESLLKATHMGRNVEKITRVTGFFSKVSGWNKGKSGELRDRYRSNV